ncbi:hypothetical protein [Microbacterium dauci]|uniref:Pyrroloquinoline-quinone binding quinoprotein n=1 Tax=Microbacterium dauci TaxID=3048008 RepID=A0ABT6ZH63_9MICO|nr:hypothetical protein [Microbacterium sp. LX3-4]MDJ1115495.1 hypothetical protein [Microbacterium sp. LX3-4]
MHALGDNDAASPKAPRSRLPWIVAGGVGAVALAAGVAIALPQLLPGTPTAAETPTETPTSVAPSPTPSDDPTPAPVTCDPSTAARIPSYELDLSATGELTRQTVVEFEAEAPSWGDPGNNAEPLGEDLVAIVASAGDDDARRTNLAVIDGGSGEHRWDITVDGGLFIVGTPLSSGVSDRLLVNHVIDGEYRLVALALDDGGELAERPATGWVSSVVGHAPQGWTAWDVASQAPGAYVLRDDDTVTRLDPDSLEPEWTIDANAIDAQRYEGNHFIAQHFDETVFVSGHPFDAESGEALDWFREGDFIAAAGVVLHHEYRFDRYDSYPLSAIDPRTGELCWTVEVLDVAGDDESLWVIGVDRDVLRLDPISGEVVEQRGTIESIELEADEAESFSLSLVGATVVTQVQPLGGMEPGATAVWTSAGPLSLPIDDYAAFNASSGDQLIVQVGSTVDTPARLVAYALDGSTAWDVEIGDLTVDSGLITEARVTDPGIIQVDILR